MIPVPATPARFRQLLPMLALLVALLAGSTWPAHADLPGAAQDEVSGNTTPGDTDSDSGTEPDADADDGAIGVIEAPDDSGVETMPYSADGDLPLETMPGASFNLAPERNPRGAKLRANPVRLAAVPVVVELFTAQGCSTCPPADALIAGLADQPDVLTLAWHVDYWDYLGWPDGFADPGHTVRQEAYAAVAGERGVYTPQIVVDGQDTLIGVGRAGLLALIDEHASRPPAVMVTASAGANGFVIDLTPRAAIPGGVELSLIRYLPRREVRVEAGENRGQAMVYRNIVVGDEKLDDWAARTPLRLTVRPGSGAGGGYPVDTRHALIVQQALSGDRPGPILAAVRLD